MVCNVVYERSPFIPNLYEENHLYSFTENDVLFIKDLGFNAVRLGVLWAGVEPIEGQFNQTYLDEIGEIINTLDKHNIQVIIDSHQDVMGERYCGEGFPNWFVDKSIDEMKPLSFPMPVALSKFQNPPSDNQCIRKVFWNYYFSSAASNSFEYFYKNPNYFSNYWRKVDTNI